MNDIASERPSHRHEEESSASRKDSGTSSLPPLLRAPLELRHKIYSLLLRCDTAGEDVLVKGDDRRSVFDYKVLSICQLNRTEAWQYFCTANRWVQAACYSSANVPSGAMTPAAITLPLDLFTAEQRTSLGTHLTLTIRLGDGCGRKKPPREKPVHRSIFAYNKHTWLNLCLSLTQTTWLWRFVSFDIMPKHQANYLRLVPDFLIYLSLFRSVKRARFTQMMQTPLFKIMASNMIRPMNQAQEWHDVLKGLKEEGDYYLSHGDFELAQFFSGLGSDYSERVRTATQNTPFEGYFMATDANLSIMNATISLSMDLRMLNASAKCQYLESRKVDGLLPADLFELLSALNEEVCGIASWTSLDACQRTKLHQLSGDAKVLLADYLSVTENREYAKAFLGLETGELVDCRTDLIEAAKDFYCAAEIDPVLGAQSKTRWNEIGQRLGTTEGLETRVVSLDVPGYGIWRGAAEFWEQHPGLLQKYAQLAKREFHLTSLERLAELKEELGIEWRDGPAGLLRLIA